MYVLFKQHLVCSQFCIFPCPILGSKMFGDAFFLWTILSFKMCGNGVARWTKEFKKKERPPYFWGWITFLMHKNWQFKCRLMCLLMHYKFYLDTTNCCQLENPLSVWWLANLPYPFEGNSQSNNWITRVHRWPKWTNNVFYMGSLLWLCHWWTPIKLMQTSTW